LLLFLGWKYARKQLGLGLVILTFISLVASMRGLRKEPSAAFYFLHYRAWEMGLGSLLAFAFEPQIGLRLPKLNRLTSETLSLFGLAGVIVPVFVYSHQTAFPGAAALPPCLGTFLLIWTSTDRLTYVGRLLATKLSVGIGMLSYSLYLWHWPLLVFGSLRKGEPLTPWEGSVILAMTGVAAWLSVRFIEKPFREKKWLGQRKHILATSTVVLLVTGTLGMTMSLTKFNNQQHASKLLEDPESTNIDIPNCRKWDVIKNIKVFSIGNGEQPGVLLLGDSFAGHWMNGLVSWGSEHDMPVHVQTIGSVIPLLDSYIPEVELKYQMPCKLRNESFGMILDRVNVKHVVLAAAWKMYIDPHGKLNDASRVVVEGKTAASMAEQRVLIAQQLKKTVQFFNARGCKVWLMLPPPEYPYNVPLKLAALVRDQAPISSSYIPEHLAEERRQVVNEFLHSVAAELTPAEVEVLDPIKLFTQNGYCVTASDDRSLYLDHLHLSYYGSLHGKQVFQPLAKSFENTMPETPAIIAGKEGTLK
jgi:hypothetical protein